MRDVIWTIIVIWLMFRLVNLFKSSTNKSTENNKHFERGSQQTEKEIKNAVRKGVNEEGEYVDFEEVK